MQQRHSGCHTEAGFAASHNEFEVVEALDDDNLLWYSICPNELPMPLSINTVKGFLKVYKVNVLSSLLSFALFNDIFQGKNLVCAFSSRLKSCLLLS